MKRIIRHRSILAVAVVLIVAAATAQSSPAAKKAAAKKESKVTEKESYKDQIAELKTTAGTITLRFFPDAAPNHVKNFLDLSRSGFYNGTRFHRIVPGFVIQGGDPNSRSGDPRTWGTGSSGKTLKAEFNKIHHGRGILSMARSQDPDSASSQFFITVADAGSLDNQYTVFGEVVSGMDVVDKIVSAPANGSMPKNPVAIESVVVRAAKESEKGASPK